jgi:SAM-dependent methyltransferase
MEYPASIARFYDLIYHKVRTSVDIDFYMERIRQTGGTILEIGAGTGRLFRAALDAGADIFAVEPSTAMLEVLNSKTDPEHKSRIQKSDAGSFRFNHNFDLILAPFRVFSHILTIEDQLKALNNIHAHLSEKGRFIMDLYVPDPGLLAVGLQDLTDFEEEFSPGNRVSRTVSMHADVVNQISHVTMILKWNEGNKQFEDTWELPMRFFHRYELEHLLERSDLRLIKILGDFNGSPLTKDSREFILVCAK